MGPAEASHPLSVRGAVLSSLPTRGPSSQEPLSQAWLWSGNFLSSQVLEKILFLPLGQVRGREPCPASVAGPLFIPFLSKGLGTLPDGDAWRGSERNRRRDTGRWKCKRERLEGDRQRREGERDGREVWGPSTGQAQPATLRHPPPPLTALSPPGIPPPGAL